MKKSAALPWFPGFYESVLDSFIDQEIEQEMEGNGEPEGSEYYRGPKTWDEVDEYANYEAARLAISKAWVNAFSKETGLKMEFEEMKSPREYNFTTDRVFVLLPEETLKKLWPMRDSDEFQKVLTDWFTPRSGFIPFYSSDSEGISWSKPIEEWDHNELSALIAAYVLHSGETEESLLKTLYEESRVYEAAQHVWDEKPKAVPVE